jgi:hypothetical protein
VSREVYWSGDDPLDSLFDEWTFKSLTAAPSADTPPAAPASPLAWLRELFPTYVPHPFAERHIAFWDWVWAIEAGVATDPFVGIWPRGGAKSTSAELAVPALGCRGKRKYVVYVRQTQEKADDSVQNIATMLESPSVQTYYPAHADRLVGKYGTVRAWRRNRLRTRGGLTVDAFGLDVGLRGAKIDEDRPDLIILDDIDDKLDTPATTGKKITIITTSILPAMAEGGTTLAIQNLIIPDGVFTRMVDGRADYLARRIVSGPHPAVENLRTEKRVDVQSGATIHVITGGTPTWAGQTLATCQRQIELWGLAAFKKEAQHEVTDRAEGLVLRFDRRRHLDDCSDDRARALTRLGQVFGGIDYGAWRFAFVLFAVDENGVPHQLAEYFAQKGPDQNHDTHARAIDAILKHYRVKETEDLKKPRRVKLWADAANPSDTTELNRAFKRLGTPYRVMSVAQENKIRKASVERLNDLLDRTVVRFRRGVQQWIAPIVARALGKLPQDYLTWQLGFNAASSGTPIDGSRLLWELEHWSYPIPQEGKAQDQDPDDHTADGADCIAAARYAIMSWWRPGKESPAEEEVSAFAPDVLKASYEATYRWGARQKRRREQAPLIDEMFGDS